MIFMQNHGYSGVKNWTFVAQWKIIDEVFWQAKGSRNGIYIPYRDDASHDVEYTLPPRLPCTQ